MNIGELRIGNWIYCNLSYVNKPVRVTGVSVVDRRDDHTGIYEEFIYLNEHDLLKDTEFNDQWIKYKQGVLSLGDISPIKLTEEILSENGFVYEDENGDTGKWKLGAFYITKSDENDYFTYNNIEIIYLHDLQNLFSATERNELKIKL